MDGGGGFSHCNGAGMSIQEQVFVWVYVCMSPCYRPGSGTEESYVTRNLTCQGTAQMFATLTIPRHTPPEVQGRAGWLEKAS